MQHEADSRPGLDAEKGGDAEQEDHESQRGGRLVPSGFALPQQAREGAHADGQPEAAARDPRPPGHRQPGGDHLIPGQFRCFELGGLAHESEVLAGGRVESVDELLAPDYVNKGMGGMDRAGFKAMLPAMSAAIPKRRLTILDLVAEGDVVVALFTYDMTLSTGEALSARGLTYYRLAKGMIVEDDPITTPDLMAKLATLMPAPAKATA